MPLGPRLAALLAESGSSLVLGVVGFVLDLSRIDLGHRDHGSDRTGRAFLTPWGLWAQSILGRFPPST